MGKGRPSGATDFPVIASGARQSPSRQALRWKLRRRCAPRGVRLHAIALRPGNTRIVARGRSARRCDREAPDHLVLLDQAGDEARGFRLLDEVVQERRTGRVGARGADRLLHG